MDNFEYSTDALEVKGAFYNKEITIYVEGIDDPIFWTEILKLVNKEAYIEDVGGCNELEKYIKKITEEDAEFYIATDRDHSDFLNENHLLSERILFTYGHSIENTMYKCNSINEIIVKYSRKVNLNLKFEIQNILTNFENKVDDLLVYDIANRRYGRGIKVFGNTCARFLKNKNSTELCETKINQFILTIKDNFTEEEIQNTNQLINNISKSKWYLVKGHFISLLIINIIKKYTKMHRGIDISINLDDIYSHTIDGMKKHENEIDVIYLINETKKLTTHNSGLAQLGF
jgi:Protein of unknown function (DUF4435)